MNNLSALNGVLIDKNYQKKRIKIFKALCLITAGVVSASAQAQMVVGPGAVVELQAGSTIEMGCNHVVVQGRVSLSPNSLITQTDDLTVLESSLLELGAGHIELAGEYNRSGNVTASGGGLTRRDFGEDCPAQLPIGPIAIDNTAGPGPDPDSMTPVPSLHGLSIGLLGMLMAWVYRRRLAPQTPRR